MVGSTPSNVFVIARNCTRITLLYTRAALMWLDMISLGNWALACNFETYRYFLPSAHMPFLLSCIYTISSLLWPRTPPHEVNHHYIYFIFVYNSLSISRLFFLLFSSLSPGRPFSESRRPYIDTYVPRSSTLRAPNTRRVGTYLP